MTDLSWLVDHCFQSIARREYDWVFVFDRDVSLVVNCLWRLLENGRIRLTSLDDGQQFGLPMPLDMVDEVTERLAYASVTRVELRECLLDLDIHFNTGHVLQIIPDSSGYEAWNLSRGPQQYLAVGGGDLAVWGG
jgi:hypothetical protein